MKVVVMLLGSSILLASCSDTKTASKGNFESVINAWIEKDPPCLSIPTDSVSVPGREYGAFPRYVEASPAKSPTGEEYRQKRMAPYEALVEAGLMKSTRTEIEQKNMFGGGEKNLPVVAYDLTDTGRAAMTEGGEMGAPSGKRRGLCYGKPQVDEITQFTEPGEMMGMKISQVTYRYHLADLPDWSKNAKIKAAFPDLARNTAASLDAKAALVLTNDGWKHEKAM